MPQHTFVPGQRVRVRSWESLAAVYGLRPNGDIACPLTFVVDMRRFCGRLLTVRELVNRGAVLFTEQLPYSWSPEMLEPVGKLCPRSRVVALRWRRADRGKLITKLCRRYSVH